MKPRNPQNPQPPRTRRPDTALLLIDFQRDFCAPGGYADRCGGLVWVRPILPRARRLLDAARARRLLVVHTREGYAPDLSDCWPMKRERTRRAGAEVGSPGPMGRFLIRGEYGHDLIDLLKPRRGEPVIDKATYGAFCRTELEAILRRRGIRRLAICGVTADVCVHTTLREATDRGFDCLYVRDAISTFDPAVRRACERMVRQEGGIWGTVTTVGRLVRAWAQVPSVPGARTFGSTSPGEEASGTSPARIAVRRGTSLRHERC